MQELKQLLNDNLTSLINILKPYKSLKVSQTVQLHIQDFIQLFSRIQFQQTKLQQLFKHIDQQTQWAPKVIKSQKLILKEKNEILNDMASLDRILQQNSLHETKHQDLSELCGEAFKNLMGNQSFEVTKPEQQSMNKNFGGEWDSKLESDCDRSFDKIRNAFKILEQAKVFEPENMQMLVKCTDSADKQIYLDFFLQIMNIQRKKRSQNKSPELRDQVMQVPVCQEFSFESPLPSLREQGQQNQAYKHVKLEDLLKIQERFITEEGSPNIKQSQISNVQQQYAVQPSQQYQSLQNQQQSQQSQQPLPSQFKCKNDASFYSQQNIKSLINKQPPKKIAIKREKILSEHIPRSNSSPSVERCKSTRKSDQFRRKISQPITDRAFYCL